jgi:cytolysin-activating lysine-acyltransferase
MTTTTNDKPKTKINSAPAEIDLEKLVKINQQVIQVLGEAVSLMAGMSKYQHLTVADIRARVLPPIVLGQCKIFRHKGFPVAFVSWALVSEEIEKCLAAVQNAHPAPRDWRSGDRLYFVDLISPKGNADEIKEAVRKELAKAAKAKGLADSADAPAVP